MRLLVFFAIFLSLNSAHASLPLTCSFLFEKKTLPTDILISAFENDYPRILNISYDPFNNVKLVAQFIKTRTSGESSPKIYVIVTDDSRSAIRQQEALDDLDLANSKNINLALEGQEGLVPGILQSFADLQNVIIITPAVKADSLLQAMKYFLNNNSSLSVDGIFIHETDLVKKMISRKKVDEFLARTKSFIYGVSSGPLSHQKKLAPFYDVAFALETLVPFDELRVSDTRYMGFWSAIEFLLQQDIIKMEQFHRERNLDIPSNPDDVYLGRGWQSWSHLMSRQRFLEPNASTNSRILNLQDAKRYMLAQKHIYTLKLYSAWKERPSFLPLRPQRAYAKQGWVSYDDFFGTARWYTYEEAQKIVQQAGLKTAEDFIYWVGRPSRMPPEPQNFYKNRGWVSWPKFVGKNKYSRDKKSFEQAHAIVLTENFKTRKEHSAWDKPEGIPSDPDKFYAGKGWIDWSYYLTGTPSSKWKSP